MGAPARMRAGGTVPSRAGPSRAGPSRAGRDAAVRRIAPRACVPGQADTWNGQAGGRNPGGGRDT
ncbi:hypothetical protein GCM10010499_06500 [Streptomyces thermoviolaceus subsp. apingens]|nr:hypothetical protein GCM10010499_06500 [Streptomyces thermoviolaceus subsp. apingens]